jgi:hypothetical protein
MASQIRAHFRPQLEALEGRWLPNNFFSPGIGHGNALLGDHAHQKSDTEETLQAALGSQAASNPGIAPLQSHPHGASYGVWSARWWQYVYSLPVDQSPFIDNTGANFVNRQSGNVWYLVGVITPVGVPASQTVTRNVTLPSGTSLFFPVVNAEFDNLNPVGPDTTLTEAQLRAGAAAFVDDAISNGQLAATVDGRPIQNLATYRVTSPAFSYTLPENNIYAAFGFSVPARTVPLAVSDGVWAMVRPLSVGQHTIHIQASVPDQDFSLDVTYNITVTPGK